MANSPETWVPTGRTRSTAVPEWEFARADGAARWTAAVSPLNEGGPSWAPKTYIPAAFAAADREIVNWCQARLPDPKEIQWELGGGQVLDALKWYDDEALPVVVDVGKPRVFRCSYTAPWVRCGAIIGAHVSEGPQNVLAGQLLHNVRHPNVYDQNSEGWMPDARGIRGSDEEAILAALVVGWAVPRATLAAWTAERVAEAIELARPLVTSIPRRPWDGGGPPPLIHAPAPGDWEYHVLHPPPGGRWVNNNWDPGSRAWWRSSC